MTAADRVLSVRCVNDDVTVCRRCDQLVARGRRVAFTAGVGNVCLPCVIGRQDQDGDAGTEPAP